MRHATLQARAHSAPSPQQSARTTGPTAPTTAVPATSHRPLTAAVSAPPVQMEGDEDKKGNFLSGLSNTFSNLSAGFGLGGSNTMGALSGQLGAMGHMVGAAQAGRSGDNVGMGLSGLSAAGSLTGMLAPRLGAAMQAPAHVRGLMSGDHKKQFEGAKGLIGLHPIGALTTAAWSHPRVASAAAKMGPGFLDGSANHPAFGDLATMTDPFGGHGF